ncbi:MAG: c-type cytochrome biogenesis protein CcsB [Mycobacteriales bacterium]
METTLAQLSDHLFTLAITAYSVAMVTFGAEYAFGRRGGVARTTDAAPARAEAAVLVGAGAPAGSATFAGRVGATRSRSTADGYPPPAAGERLPAEHAEADDAEADDAEADDADDRVARMGRLGLALAIIGALVQATSIAIRGAAVDRVPWGNMYEFSSVASLIAVVAFLVVLIRQPQLRYLGVFLMLPVIVLMFLAGTVLYARAATLVPALHSYWLAIHVSAAAVGTGIFLVSSVGTMLYLVRRRYEQVVVAGDAPGAFAGFGARLPAASALDRMAYRTAAFGFPLYTFAIICGAIWAEAAWGKYWSWDPKETWALITWIVYAAYLHARSTAGWKGTAASVINLLGFGTMIVNFFVINIVVSGLHSYAGLN